MLQVGLWVRDYNKKDGSGKGKFFSGKLGYVSIPPNASLAIFKNENKTKESQPDYYLHVSEPFEKKDVEFVPTSNSAASAKSDDFGSDIPF